MTYFVIPIDEISDLMMAEAVESDKSRLRTNNAGTKAVLSVPGVPTYAFSMRQRYGYEDIRYLLEQPEWDNDLEGE